MRHPNLVGMVALFVVGACATGQSLGDSTGDFLGYDASLEGSTSFGSGGTSPVESGGFPQASGGSVTQGSGGTATGSVTGGGGSGNGGSSNGGARNSGGTMSTGGTASGGAKASGGAVGSGGAVAVDSGTGCVANQKKCASDGLCWPIAPPHGCDTGATCTPCPAAPANGVEQCVSGKCDFVCYSGYTKNGSSCVGAGTGGAGGGGTGGGGGSGCPGDKSMCGGCIPVIQAPCCKGSSCGCAYPFASCN